MDKLVLETRLKTFITKNHGQDIAAKLFDTTSLWSRMLKRVYAIDRFCSFVLKKDPLTYPPSGLIVENLDNRIWAFSQTRSFVSQLAILRENKVLPKTDKLYRLSPIISRGLICVNSRVQTEISSESCPIVLTCEDHIVRVFIRRLHMNYRHVGKSHMIALLPERFHILGLNRFLKKMLASCRICVKLHARPINPLMAPLPSARINPAPRPFTDTGIDYFGPLQVSQGRKTVKIYGVLFTCLASRAVHLEAATSLDVSSFIAAFRRFTSRRGNPSKVYSDQGTNLVGARNVLLKEFESLDKVAVKHYASQKKIDWQFSPP